MQGDKNEVISAIENISSVSEETAAASQEVATTTEVQQKSIEHMTKSARTLNDLINELEQSLEKYKV
jgi:methyl-accepting chemotaxis protein